MEGVFGEKAKGSKGFDWVREGAVEGSDPEGYSTKSPHSSSSAGVIDLVEKDAKVKSPKLSSSSSAIIDGIQKSGGAAAAVLCHLITLTRLSCSILRSQPPISD